MIEQSCFMFVMRIVKYLRMLESKNNKIKRTKLNHL